MMATGVVRGRPLLRPRMVISALRPNGTPAASRNLRIGLKNVTYEGAPGGRADVERSSCGSFVRRFGVVTEVTRQKART